MDFSGVLGGRVGGKGARVGDWGLGVMRDGMEWEGLGGLLRLFCLDLERGIAD